MNSRRASFAAVLFLSPLAMAGLDGSAAGIRWAVPATWTVEPPRPMRVATYAVPAGKGAEPGECAVFYFGRGQGGSPEENITRWGSQFEGAPAPATSIETINGLRVHLAQTSGTYLAPGGPKMQSQGKRPGYRLLGAIVEAPEGLVFLKCTGPAATLSAAERDFQNLLRSMKKAALTKV